MKKLKVFDKDLILFLIIILGGLLRLLGLKNITLGGDLAIHWQTAFSIVKLGEFPLLGPNASINNRLFLGPLYYYLLAIPYFLGNGDFRAAIIFFSILSTFSIYLLFKVCQKFFTREQSLKITALYSFSSYMIQIGNAPWNPYLLPLLIFISILFLKKIKEGKYKYVAPLFLIFGLAIQAHATAIFLIIVFLTQIPLKKIKFRYFFFGISLFLISISPWIIANFKCNYCQSQELLNIFLTNKKESCNFFQWINYHGHGENCFHEIRTTLFVFRLMSESLFGSRRLFLVLLVIISTIWYAIRIKSPNKQFFILWLTIPTFLFLFYSTNVYLHYFLIFIPLPFIIFTFVLEKIKKSLKSGNLISSGIFFFVIVLNLMQFLFSLNSIRE